MYEDNCCFIYFAIALVGVADMLISPLPVVNDGAWIHRVTQWGRGSGLLPHGATKPSSIFQARSASSRSLRSWLTSNTALDLFLQIFSRRLTTIAGRGAALFEDVVLRAESQLSVGGACRPVTPLQPCRIDR
jgi:hypothetical protein